MTRLRYNAVATALLPLSLGAALTNSGTTITFNAALKHSGGTAVPTIVAPNYIPLTIIDPLTLAASEVVYLTAYTAGATTGTISRGQEGTTGVAHASGDRVVQGALVEDVNGLSLAPAAGAGGIPGAAYHQSAGVGTTSSIAGGTTHWFPFAIDRPISVTGVTASIVSGGTAGTLMRAALYHADSGWLPTTLIRDFGTVAVDSGGLKTFTAGPDTIGPGRYFLSIRQQTAATQPTYRTLIYNCPQFAPHINTNWSQFISGLKKTEAYAAYPDPAVVWDTVTNSSSSPTFTIPLSLTWTDA